MTARFRRKTEPVEAFRLGFDKQPDWFRKAILRGDVINSTEDLTYTKAIKVTNSRGEEFAFCGYWIMMGYNEHIFARTDIYFRREYERVSG